MEPDYNPLPPPPHTHTHTRNRISWIFTYVGIWSNNSPDISSIHVRPRRTKADHFSLSTKMSSVPPTLEANSTESPAWSGSPELAPGGWDPGISTAARWVARKSRRVFHLRHFGGIMRFYRDSAVRLAERHE